MVAVVVGGGLGDAGVAFAYVVVVVGAVAVDDAAFA